MRLNRVSCFLLVALAASVGAAAPPAPVKKGPVIPRPVTPAVDPPAPAPAPDTPILLPPRVELLVTHDAKCLVRAFPADRVQIKRLHVPPGRDHTLSGTFVDPKDAGKTTEADQTFSGPCWVYRVSAKEAGPCVLLIATGVDDDEVQVVNLDCLAPRPPPKPVDPVVPPVDPVVPPPKPVPQGFRVIFAYETSAPMTQAAQRVMFGEKVRTYLDANAKGWRRFDKDADAANERDADVKALWLAAKPQLTAVPCVIVAVGGKADILPLPADEDAAVELFKKYATGGK